MSDHQAGLPGLAGQLGNETGGQGGQGGQGGEGGVGKTGKTGKQGVKGEKGDTPQSDEFFMSRPLWLGMKRWTWVKLAFFGMMVMGMYSLFLVSENSKSDRNNRDDIILEAVGQADFHNCIERNELRQSLRQLVVAATEGSGGGIDLTVVPGFSDLDEATQQFFRNLATPRTEEEGQSTRDRLLSTIVDEACPTFPDVTTPEEE